MDASTDPSLRNDEDWIIEMGVTIAYINVEADSLYALNAPASLSRMDWLAEQGALKVKKAMASYTQAIDTGRPGMLLSYQEHMDDALLNFEVLAEEIASLCDS